MASFYRQSNLTLETETPNVNPLVESSRTSTDVKGRSKMNKAPLERAVGR